VKPPILVGIGIAVVFLAAALLSPMFVDSNRKTAREARDKAELARRELVRVTIQSPLAEACVDAAGLKSASLEPIVEKAAPDLKRLSSEVGAAQQRAQAAGVAIPELTAPSANAAGVKKALADFEAALKADDALLMAAIKDAGDAVQVNKDALGVAQVLGMAQYVRAAELLGQAESLRNQQYEQQAALIKLALDWKDARGRADHYRGLDVNPILTGLQADLKELAAAFEEAKTKLATLTEQVAQREQALTRVQQDMTAARDALLKLEAGGFAAGDDAAFAAYRQKYLEFAGQLGQLQQQEQELRYGGRHGAELVGLDPSTAELRGGEAVTGLEELQRRLALAKDRHDRLSQANVSLEEQIKFVAESGKQSAGEAQRYDARVAEYDAEQVKLLEDVNNLAKAALAKEADALKAAESATRAFKQSQDAASAYVRAAREASQQDTARQNQRINAILRDPYLEQFAQSAKAASRVLEGRIHALRIRGLQSLLTDLRIFGEIKPGTTFDFGSSEDDLKNAKTAGMAALEDARGVYERLAGANQAPANNTAWVPQAALAAVQHLMSLIDPDQATKLRGDALAAITKAVEKRDRNPYLATYVQFRDHLAGPSEQKKSDADDLFGGPEEKKSDEKKGEPTDEKKP